MAPARAGRIEDSITALEPLARRGASGEAEALGHRAWLLRAAGRFDEARAAYRRLMELRPGNAEVEALLIDLDRFEGRGADAVARLARLYAEHPTNGAVFSILRSAAASLGLEERRPAYSELPPPPQPVRAFNSALETLESWPGMYPYSSFPEVGRFVYSVVRSIRPHVLVETGTYRAYSTITMAQALEDNGMGHLHTFDIFMDRPGEKSPVIGECADSYRVASAHIGAAGLAHRITMHKGDSAAHIAAFFAETKLTIDLAYVDGDHTEKGAIRDINAILPHLRPGGFIMLHDTMPEACGWLGPRRVVEAVLDSHKVDITVVNLPTPEGFGVALLQLHTGQVDGFREPTLLRSWTESLFLRRHQR
ncbi:MAG: class I SAM-dependent methyltransferase [Candidatus Sumerlaeia bacterium]|nr:class I SAM-dependent methyltransferase [Candidatus Sumerlaeia bacterium]